MKALILTLLLSLPVLAQVEHPKHPTSGDFYESLRILPITILYRDPVTDLIDYRYEDEMGVEVGRFQVTRSTQFKGKGKDVMVIYCAARHGTGPNQRHKYLIYVESVEKLPM